MVEQVTQLPARELLRPLPCTDSPCKDSGFCHSNQDEMISFSLLQVAADLKTSEDLVACYKGQPLATSKGVCTVKSIAGGGIK